MPDVPVPPSDVKPVDPELSKPVPDVKRPRADRRAAIKARLPVDPEARAKAIRLGTSTNGKVRLL